MAELIRVVQQQTPDELKQMVREAYSARIEAKSGCCDSDTGNGAVACCGDSPATTYYNTEERSVGGEAAESSLGCGNPFAIANIHPGDTVLDLGSGAGFDTFIAAQHVGATGHVIGVDFTPAMLERARSNATKLGLTNAEFLEGDIEALPLPDQSVDVVISNCVINLVPDKAQAFREAFRVLKPGGRLAVSDITLPQQLPQAMASDPTLYCSCIGGAISEADYLHAIQSAGFTQIEVAERVPYATTSSCCGSSDLPALAYSVRVVAVKPE